VPDGIDLHRLISKLRSRAIVSRPVSGSPRSDTRPCPRALRPRLYCPKASVSPPPRPATPLFSLGVTSLCLRAFLPHHNRIALLPMHILLREFHDVRLTSGLEGRTRPMCRRVRLLRVADGGQDSSQGVGFFPRLQGPAGGAGGAVPPRDRGRDRRVAGDARRAGSDPCRADSGSHWRPSALPPVAPPATVPSAALPLT
jgi:hypothetical protein